MAWRVVKKHWLKPATLVTKPSNWISKDRTWQPQPKWVANQKRWQPKWNNTRSSPTIWVQGCSPDTEVDGTVVYSGTVKRYYKWKGAGFIDMDDKGVVPGDSVFVHWSNIQTDDRFPFLTEGMRVEFGLQVWRFAKKQWQPEEEAQIRAKYVTDIGGAMLALQDRLDAEKKIFVDGQHHRYSGTLEYYDPKAGTGYVTIDDGFAFSGPVPKRLLVEEPEVNAGGKRPQKMGRLRVEFGIWQSKTAQYKAYNMTLPDNLIMTRENLERRNLVGPQMFSGTICQWWWKQGWGFISPRATAEYPPLVTRKLNDMQAAAQRKSNGREVPQVLYFCQKDMQKGFTPKKGNACMFQIYIDDKGVGATNIQ